jgi:hypothetical protein
MGEPGDTRQRPPLRNAKPLLFCLLASLSAHVAVLILRSAPKEEPVALARDPFIVRIDLYMAKSEADTPELQPQEEEQVPEDVEPVSGGPAQAPEPAQPASTDQPRRIRHFDIKGFVESYDSPDEQPEELVFRPALRRRLEERRTEQNMQAIFRRNRVQRHGHEADDVNSIGSMAKIGAECYSISAPSITIQRGQPIAQVECPGKLDWWEREQLDAVTLFSLEGFR